MVRSSDLVTRLPIAVDLGLTGSMRIAAAGQECWIARRARGPRRDSNGPSRQYPDFVRDLKQTARQPFRAPRRTGEEKSASSVRDRQLRLGLVEELLVLGRALERGRRGLATLDGLRDGVEIAGADLALMFDGSEALRHRREFGFLQLDKRSHLVVRITMRQVEHRVVEAVEPGQRDELELVAHRAQLALESGDRAVVEIFFPVERRRAVVRAHLARVLRVDAVGERIGELK